MRGWDFWSTVPPVETEKIWRPCLGGFTACLKRVRGYRTDRMCQKCTRHNNYRKVAAGTPSEDTKPSTKVSREPKKASRRVLRGIRTR